MDTSHNSKAKIFFFFKQFNVFKTFSGPRKYFFCSDGIKMWNIWTENILKYNLQLAKINVLAQIHFSCRIIWNRHKRKHISVGVFWKLELILKLKPAACFKKVGTTHRKICVMSKHTWWIQDLQRLCHTYWFAFHLSKIPFLYFCYFIRVQICFQPGWGMTSSFHICLFHLISWVQIPVQGNLLHPLKS